MSTYFFTPRYSAFSFFTQIFPSEKGKTYTYELFSTNYNSVKEYNLFTSPYPDNGRNHGINRLFIDGYDTKTNLTTYYGFLNQSQIIIKNDNFDDANVYIYSWGQSLSNTNDIIMNYESYKNQTLYVSSDILNILKAMFPYCTLAKIYKSNSESFFDSTYISSNRTTMAGSDIRQYMILNFNEKCKWLSLRYYHTYYSKRTYSSLLNFYTSNTNYIFETFDCSNYSSLLDQNILYTWNVGDNYYTQQRGTTTTTYRANNMQIGFGTNNNINQ